MQRQINTRNSNYLVTKFCYNISIQQEGFMKRILVVEDELSLQKALVKGLRAFNFVVDSASDGNEALDCYYDNYYDLIILDLNLPYIDGIDLLKEFRHDNVDLNIIILSARDEVEDKVKGLNLGANDYLAKPFNFEELVARVQALLRREFLQHTQSIIIGDYCLNTTHRELKYFDTTINISRKEYDLLFLLFTNQNTCLESMTLIDKLWLDETGSIDKLKVLINKLRKKLPTDLIKNKWGVGYYVAKT